MANMLANAHRATGDLASAVVLLRIAFWEKHARASGREWTAQSYADLMEETACSQKQIKRALSRLRELNLVETKRGLFRNRNVNHFRLTHDGQQALQGLIKPALQGPSEQALEGPFYIQGDTTGSDNMEIISEQSLAGDVEGEFKVAEKVIRPKTVQELLMSSEKKGTGKPAKKAGSVSALEQAWKEAVSEVYACFVPQLTQKQLGMLKHFREKAPAGKSEKVLDWAVRNWIEFVKAVETKVGLKTTPAEPRLDFLLLHVGIAANMAIVTPKSATVKQEAPVAKKPPHVPQLISQKQAEEEATPSVAELLAILNDKDPS